MSRRKQGIRGYGLRIVIVVVVVVGFVVNRRQGLPDIDVSGPQHDQGTEMMMRMGVVVVVVGGGGGCWNI